MKKIFALSVLLTAVCLIQSCVDKIVVANLGPPQGKIVLESKPPGAEIYLLGTNTNKVTPDSIDQLNSGEYDITLKKENYRDTTVTITVIDSLTTYKMVVLQSIFEIGNIFVESEPAGADIFLDSLKTNNITPDTLTNLIVGEHEITLKKENYRDTSFTITVKSKETASKLVVMTSLVKTGNIFVESEPTGAEIFLDSLKTNNFTPDTLTNLIVGEHKITLKKENYRDTSFTITVKSEGTASKLVVMTSLVKTGNIYIETNPSGAQIFLDSMNTNKVAPDTLKNIVVGSHKITLKKSNYIDTTISVTVLENSTVSKTVELKPVITKGNIYIVSNPSGAQIFLDDVNTDKITPDTLKNIATGNHKITLKEDNYIDTTVNVTVLENRTISKSVILTPKVKKGNIFITSNPTGAQILLDSINTGKTTPDTLKDIAAGDHTITLKKNNYVDTTLIVTIQENQTISKSITLSPIIIRGNIYLESQPGGAEIFIDGKNTNKVTPDTLLNYPVGTHSITLKKNNYRDTTFQVNVIGYLTLTKKVTLTSIFGSIFIQSNPSGADIYLSDNSTGKTTPDTIKSLLVGVYKITLKYPGYNDTTFYANVSQNTVTSKNITLVKTIEYGDLFMQSNPSGATIYVDNDNTGKYTPDTIYGLVVGDHDVTLKLSGYFDANLTVNIQKNTITSKNITLSERLPIQTDTLYYGIVFGNIKFTFSFNQDVTLYSADVIEPDSTNKKSFDLGGQVLSKGSTQNIYYDKYLTGEWQLIFYGKKADTGNSFTLKKSLTIP